jgi:hypothetical protein
MGLFKPKKKLLKYKDKKLIRINVFYSKEEKKLFKVMVCDGILKKRFNK